MREGRRERERLYGYDGARRPSGNHPFSYAIQCDPLPLVSSLALHHPVLDSLPLSLLPSLSLSLGLPPSLSLSPLSSFRLSPSSFWHDVSPFRRSILLSSSAPRLVWAPTERYHIKFRALCSEHLGRSSGTSRKFSRANTPVNGRYYLYLSLTTPRDPDDVVFTVIRGLLSIFLASLRECKFLFDVFPESLSLSLFLSHRRREKSFASRENRASMSVETNFCLESKLSI